jgi:hypothetical protein
MCTYLAELDLKGSIPDFVIKQAFKDQGNQIVKLRKVTEKILKEKGML